MQYEKRNIELDALYFIAKRSINIPFGLLILAKSFKWFN